MQAGQVELGVLSCELVEGANKYCSTVSAFNIAHANCNWSMYIGHILEIRAQGNYEVSNSILWK